MRRLLLIAILALLGALAELGAEAPKAMQMLNLSCVEALAAVGQEGLAGVFSFISEEDGPAAFADLLVRNKKAMNKFLVKVQKDLKEVSGVSTWDRAVLQFALAIYASPLAEMLEKPAQKTVAKIAELAQAPAMSLQEMTVRRRKG